MRWLTPPHRMAGLAIAAVGVVASVAAAQLPMGSARSPGPGAFPLAVGATLIVLGLIMAARDGVPADRHDAPAGTARRVTSVMIGVVLFGLAIERAGLLLASALLVAAASSSDTRQRPRDIILLAAMLSLAAAVLFVLVLGLPVSILPRGAGFN